MVRFRVQVVDTYSIVTAACGATYQNCSICRKTPCSYHYTPEGYELISRPIATAMRALLLAD